MGMQPVASPMATLITIWNIFITMPTTAVGMWAYCSCEKISSSAPYFFSILSTTAIESTMEIWTRKLAAPSGAVRRRTLPRTQRASRSRRMVFILKR